MGGGGGAPRIVVSHSNTTLPATVHQPIASTSSPDTSGNHWHNSHPAVHSFPFWSSLFSVGTSNANPPGLWTRQDAAEHQIKNAGTLDIGQNVQGWIWFCCCCS